jgi:hypothetical protein
MSTNDEVGPPADEVSQSALTHGVGSSAGTRPGGSVSVPGSVSSPGHGDLVQVGAKTVSLNTFVRVTAATLHEAIRGQRNRRERRGQLLCVLEEKVMSNPI